MALELTFSKLYIQIFNSNCFIDSANSRCLKWVAIAARHPYPHKNGHAAELKYYKQFENEINDTGIEWPITLQQIPKFERQNRYRSEIFFQVFKAIVH
jgi:hypothetical protein